MAEVDEATKAWAAGFFDGEGTITIQRSGYLLLSSLGNTNKDVLEYMRFIWGGSLTSSEPRKRTHRRLWILRWNEGESYDLIVDILSYSKVKRSLLEYGKEFLEGVKVYYSLRSGGRGQPRKTGVELAYRKRGFEIMKALQTRGKIIVPELVGDRAPEVNISRLF